MNDPLPPAALAVQRERPLQSASGYTAIAAGVLLMVLGVAWLIAMPGGGLLMALLRVAMIVAGVFVLVGLYMLQPGQKIRLQGCED